jgi:hypothetical protein
MPHNGVDPAVTRTVRETDWTSIIERLIDLGKILGPGSVRVVERSIAASFNFYVAFKSGIKDSHNTKVENRVRNDLPGDSTAETSGERSQGDSNSVHQISEFEYEELQPTGSTEGLKQRVATAYNETRE